MSQANLTAFKVKNGLIVVQWNCRGLYRKLYELKGLLTSLKPLPDVITLQETHLIEKYSPKLSGYYYYRQDKSLRSGGLAIFVRHDLSSSLLNLPRTSIESMGININGINIINMYIPPDCHLRPRDLEFLKSYTSHSLIVGDFNAHHYSWSSQYTNQRGTILNEFVNQQNFVITNQNVPTRLNTATNAGNRFSLLDLTIASPDTAIKCQTEVSHHLLGSDHFLVFTSYNVTVTRCDPRPPVWSLSKANWPNFSLLVDEKLAEPLPDDIDTLNEQFTEILIASASPTIPRTKHSKLTPVPWWSVACKTAVRKKRAAYRKMKRTFHFIDVINFKKLRSLCRKTILRAKRDYWEDFCCSIDNRTNINKVWKIFKSIANPSSRQSALNLVDENKVPINNDVDKANVLGHEFASVSRSANYPLDFRVRKFTVDLQISRSLPAYSADVNCMDQPFTLHELQKAIGSRKKSSPGLDSVCYDMLKNLSELALSRLLHMYNLSWSSGYVPKSWRHSAVVPLLKRGKDQTSAKSYRPISLTSHLCKVMEVMVANRLRWFLESKNLFNENQSGFRKGRNTLHHIIRLHDVVHKAINHKRSVIAVFLDIKRAYDMVWRNGLLSKLMLKGVSGRMIKWLNSFLQDRSFVVRIGGSLSRVFSLGNGIPQGSVLSPLLFAVMIDDLPAELSSPHGLFADDCAIWIDGLNIPDLLIATQSSLNSVADWCRKWGFAISESKSVAMLFTRRRNIGSLSLDVNGSPLTFVEKFKYLGVTFDTKLTYRNHVDTIVTKCSNQMNLMKLLTGTYWGAGKNLF